MEEPPCDASLHLRDFAVTQAVQSPFFRLLGCAGLRIVGGLRLRSGNRDSSQLQHLDALPRWRPRGRPSGDGCGGTDRHNHVRAHLDSRLSSYPISISATATARRSRSRPTARPCRRRSSASSASTRSTWWREPRRSRPISRRSPRTSRCGPADPRGATTIAVCLLLRRQPPAPGDRGRSQMTASPTMPARLQFHDAELQGERDLLYRLYNVRNARTQPWLWGQCQPRHAHRQQSGGLGEPLGQQRLLQLLFGHALSGGVRAQFENNVPILETVICQTSTSARTESKAGSCKRPKPHAAAGRQSLCTWPYIYFGWEDRRPGMAGPTATMTNPRRRRMPVHHDDAPDGCPLIE